MKQKNYQTKTLKRQKTYLKDEQKSVDEIIEIFADGNINISIDPIKDVINTIEKIKELINSNEANQALTLLDRTKMELNNFLNNLANDESKSKLLILMKKIKYKITSRKICR